MGSTGAAAGAFALSREARRRGSMNSFWKRGVADGIPVVPSALQPVASGLFGGLCTAAPEMRTTVTWLESQLLPGAVI